MEEFHVKMSDTFFYNSPDAGDPSCICSRCLKKISEGPVVRAWPEPGDHGFDSTAKGGTEFRYCNECLTKMGFLFLGKGLDDGNIDFDEQSQYGQ